MAPRRHHLRGFMLGASGVVLLVTALSALIRPASSSAAAVAPPHDRLTCSECHEGEPSATGVRCATESCHPAVGAEFRSSSHDQRHLAGQPVASACVTCHGGHSTRSGRDALVAACEGGADRACLQCHDVKMLEVTGQTAPPTGSAESGGPRHVDAHSTATLTRGCEATAISCFACHGAHTVLGAGEPDSPINQSNVATTCGGCHAAVATLYASSAHARSDPHRHRYTPTCVSCHGSHGVLPVTSPTAPTSPTQVVYACARCHDDPLVLRDTELPAAPVERFEHTFHGVAYAHGIADVANCVTCHGAHEVVPADDPRSPVSPGRIEETCGACHSRVTPAMIDAVSGRSLVSRLRDAVASLRIYFPVAETSVNPLLVSGMGALVGFLSGLFGVGGGFLMTPLLIFIGIPAAVAAATDAAQISAGATSGAISHSRLGNVDFKMGLTIVVGGWSGGYVGVQLVHLLRGLGNFDFYLKLVYVLILGFIGVTMLLEGVRTLRGSRATSEPGPSRLTVLFSRLPLQMSFPRSGLRTSALLPIFAGFAVGVLAAFLGVGGGFIMLPAMIYIIGIPTRVAVGTDLFQIVLTSANVTLQQAITNHTVDLMLAVTLFAGSTIGAQFGVHASRYLKGEQIRVFLALIVLIVMAVLLYQLLSPPDALIDFARSGGGH